MPKFLISETIHTEKIKTVRLGSLTSLYGYQELGKAVKLTAESRYELSVPGDAIEAYVTSSEYATSGTVAKATVDGYSMGGICSTGYKEVTLDGLQGTLGTGVVAIGDYIVVGTVADKGTANVGPLKVAKATDQTAAKIGPFKARVVSLGKLGTGAVGTVAVVELF